MTQTKALLLAVLQLVSVASSAVEAHAPQQTGPSHGSAPQDSRPGGGIGHTEKESALPPLIATVTIALVVVAVGIMPQRSTYTLAPMRSILLPLLLLPEGFSKTAALA